MKVESMSMQPLRPYNSPLCVQLAKEKGKEDLNSYCDAFISRCCRRPFSRPIHPAHNRVIIFLHEKGSSTGKLKTQNNIKDTMQSLPFVQRIVVLLFTTPVLRRAPLGFRGIALIVQIRENWRPKYVQCSRRIRYRMPPCILLMATNNLVNFNTSGPKFGIFLISALDICRVLFKHDSATCSSQAILISSSIRYTRFFVEQEQSAIQQVSDADFVRSIHDRKRVHRHGHTAGTERKQVSFSTLMTPDVSSIEKECTNNWHFGIPSPRGSIGLKFSFRCFSPHPHIREVQWCWTQNSSSWSWPWLELTRFRR